MKRGRVLVTIFLSLAIIAASCEGYRFESSDPCKCPTLVETAPTIDFIGDGQTPIAVRSNFGGEPRPLQVDLEYAAADGQLVQSVIARRLIEAGFEHDIVNDEDHFVADQWEVFVGGARVRVMIADPDRDTAKALAPLMDALGLVP